MTATTYRAQREFVSPERKAIRTSATVTGGICILGAGFWGTLAWICAAAGGWWWLLAVYLGLSAITCLAFGITTIVAGWSV